MLHGCVFFFIVAAIVGTDLPHLREEQWVFEELETVDFWAAFQALKFSMLDFPKISTKWTLHASRSQLSLLKLYEITICKYSVSYLSVCPVEILRNSRKIAP